MAQTPEAKVKKRIIAILHWYGAYHFYPVTGGYGRSGVPDIVVCWKGKFIGIECKANGNTLTALQMKNLRDIANNAGVAISVDESGVNSFALLLAKWNEEGLPSGGYLGELTKNAQQTE